MNVSNCQLCGKQMFTALPATMCQACRDLPETIKVHYGGFIGTGSAKPTTGEEELTDFFRKEFKRYLHLYERKSAQLSRFIERKSAIEAELSEVKASEARLVERAKHLLDVAQANEPTFQAHVRYTYADVQKIFEPIRGAMMLLSDAVADHEALSQRGKG